MTATYAPMPKPPMGWEACRTWGDSGGRRMLTHLVRLDERGSNGGRPTACGLSRFDTRDATGRKVADAQLTGWGMGDSGTSGPGVEQARCVGCWAEAGAPL